MKIKPVLGIILACTLLVGGWVFTASNQKSPDAADSAVPIKPSEIPASRESRILTDLIDPAKLAALKGDRSANPRMRKITYWLEFARRLGQDPDAVLRKAQHLSGDLKTIRAEADRDSLLRNRTILEKLGCLNEIGMDRLRRGLAPTITLGPYAGDIASVDHILPFSVVPELDTCLFNLEFMPSRLNENKGAKVGRRQLDLARKWHEAGLLSKDGFQAIASQFHQEN